MKLEKGFINIEFVEHIRLTKPNLIHMLDAYSVAMFNASYRAKANNLPINKEEFINEFIENYELPEEQ